MQQVAEAIAATLRASELRVDVLRARLVISGEGWDLLVPGTPLHSGRWHRDAHRFLKRHRRELAPMPVAVFAMGHAPTPKDVSRRSRSQLGRAPTRRARLRPVATAVFGGVGPAGQEQHRDLRDWAAIRNWAADTATQGPTASTARTEQTRNSTTAETPTRTAV